ncbi:MAG: thioredoxin domain-containing protein [Flaviflexus sp.]|uniref:DsbA family protein n=1 Tax=Flaviflexus sp. TaxID=1969482 RepID=UPI00352D1F55
MTYGSPQNLPPYGQPPQQGSRNRGLLIAVVVLLVAVIVLAVALVLSLDSNDESLAEQATIDTSSAEGADSGGASGTDSGTAENQDGEATADETFPEEVADPTTAATQNITDPDVMAAEIHRDPNDPYALGDPDADIVIVKYADFRCGYCALWHHEVFPSLEPLIESGQVRFEYRDLPVLGDSSVFASSAARAAGNQGKYWEYSDALYTDTYEGVNPSYDLAYFVSVAEEVGVPDLDLFSEEMQSTEILQEIMDSREHGLNLGLTGTPAFIINDTVVPGYVEEPQFMEIVDSKLP